MIVDIVIFFSVLIVSSILYQTISARFRKKNLWVAMETKNIEKVRDILLKNPEIVRTTKGDLIFSPLWLAIRCRCKEIVKLVIDYGANVNEFDSNGNTILHHLPMFFPEWENLKIFLEILIERGVNINVNDDQTKTTPLQIAAGLGRMEYTEFLLENGAKLEGSQWVKNFPMSVVLDAPKNKQTEILKLFIKHGLDTTWRHQPTGADCLQYCIAREPAEKIDIIEIAKVLLNNKISVNSLDNGGISTLTYAVRLQNIELISFLIEQGAKLQFNTNPEKLSLPLITAVHCENEDIMDLLLSKGVEINEKDENRWTVLHEACQKLLEKSIKFLIRRGASISEEDLNGDTPFSLLEPQLYQAIDARCINTMVKEMALVKFANDLSVSKNDMNLVEAHPVVRKLFQNCTEELYQMSEIKFYSSYSYYSVWEMSKNIKKLVELTKNEEFVTKYEENLLKFSCYCDDLQIIYNKAIKERDRSLNVIYRLYSIFGKHLPDVVIRKLSENLTLEDLPLE